MELSVLIAEPHDILRKGLQTILATDERIATLVEVRSVEELKKHLCGNPVDLIIVNQTLVSDMTILPASRFVLLTSEFNIITFLMACKYGAKGYLLETSQAELFRAILGMPPGAFLIEPALTVNIVGYLTNDTHLIINEELLTPREKEIVELLREGIARPTIAEQLSISNATLKTHIKNIFRKRVTIVV